MMNLLAIIVPVKTHSAVLFSTMDGGVVFQRQAGGRAEDLSEGSVPSTLFWKTVRLTGVKRRLTARTVRPRITEIRALDWLRWLENEGTLSPQAVSRTARLAGDACRFQPDQARSNSSSRKTGKTSLAD